MLYNLNKEMEEEVTYGELLRFMRIRLKIATTVGFQRRDFWAENENGLRNAPFNFNRLMTRDRFEEILKKLSFTKANQPTYKDRIFEHREIESEWNRNMKEQYAPSDRSTLDESMKKWVNQFTCPGFMVVPHKPWPFGNDYISICDYDPYVMYQVEMVEGKDRPPELGVREFDEMGKTVGKMLRLTKPIWRTGTKVTMDNGFCVAKGLVELYKRGVLAAIQVKKRKYWPTYFKADVIKEHFRDKKVGYTNSIGVELEGVKFYIH